jgi:methylenetetrahydrofolate--tRNA-(uracil-5-)-methyltransferase
MNVNFGLMPPIGGRTKKAERKKAYTDRAREALAGWLVPTANSPKAIRSGSALDNR